jgi:hypothetical protein
MMKMARKMCDMGCGRAVGTGTAVGVDPDATGTMCNFCYTEGGWENEHNDNDHTDPDNADYAANCWICHEELNLAQRPVKVGHTNTVAKSHTSHAGHNHLRTPYYRSLCRKSVAAGHGPYDADAPKV